MQTVGLNDFAVGVDFGNGVGFIIEENISYERAIKLMERNSGTFMEIWDGSHWEYFISSVL